MDVVCVAPKDDVNVAVAAACDAAGLDLVVVDEWREERHPQALAVVTEVDAADPAAAPLRDGGAYRVAVLATPDASAVFRALRRGYSFAFSRPLAPARLAHAFSYLRDVAPPLASQVLELGDGVVLVGDRAVALAEAEHTLLRLLGEAEGRVVPREELSAAVPSDPLRVAASLKLKLTVAGSSVKLLKVPHIGLRLVGVVRPVAD